MKWRLLKTQESVTKSDARKSRRADAQSNLKQRLRLCASEHPHITMECIMKKVIFVTGGARSGKSAFSEQAAKALGKDLVYIATMEPLDGEMKARIKKHISRRGKDWKTIEEPLKVVETLKKNDKNGRVFLMDCLTLFISNHMLNGVSGSGLEKKARELASFCKSCKASVVIVSNEVGMGLVPDNALGRKFRDAQGIANKIIAAAADEVFFTVSGIPIQVKQALNSKFEILNKKQNEN